MLLDPTLQLQLVEVRCIDGRTMLHTDRTAAALCQQLLHTQRARVARVARDPLRQRSEHPPSRPGHLLLGTEPFFRHSVRPICRKRVENTHTATVSTATAPPRPEKFLERRALEVVQSAGANGGVLDDDRRFFGGAAQAGRETTMCAVNACERARVAHSEAGTHRLERAQQGRLVQLW
jgi:hypothetical protein